MLLLIISEYLKTNPAARLPVKQNKCCKKISAVPVGKGRHFCVTVPVWAVLFPAPAMVVPILKSYPRCGVQSGR